MDNTPHNVSKLHNELAELKSDFRLSNFKMERTEQSIEDIKTILEKLSNVYTEQSLIQRDILAIYKEVSGIQASTEEVLKFYAPLRDELTANVSAFKSGLRVLVFTFSILQGIVGWGLGQAYSTIKDMNIRIEELNSNYKVLDSKFRSLSQSTRGDNYYIPDKK